MTQHTSQPTRYKPGQRSSVLDLNFTLDPDNVDNFTYLPSVGSSVLLGHTYVIKDFILTVIATGMKFNYCKGDYASMNEILSGKHFLMLLTLKKIR